MDCIRREEDILHCGEIDLTLCKIGNDSLKSASEQSGSKMQICEFSLIIKCIIQQKIVLLNSSNKIPGF